MTHVSPGTENVLKQIEGILFFPEALAEMSDEDLRKLHEAAVCRKEATQAFELRLLHVSVEMEIEEQSFKEMQVNSCL